jgi:pimeloyl-ACP methyl ester carboxylesterase
MNGAWRDARWVTAPAWALALVLALPMAATPVVAAPADDGRVVLGAVPGQGVAAERGYARTALGQVHYQDVRPAAGAAAGSPVYVLLHQVPWSHLYFTRVQSQLAARGIRSVAIDTPGYGLSSRLQAPPSIADYAGAIRETLDSLGLARVVVAGHHTGVTIGSEIARSAPERVGCLVMNGVPLYTAAEAKARLEAPHWDQTYRADGSHLTDRWTFLSGRVAGTPESLHWSLFSLFLSGPDEWFGHHAVFRYDMADTLRALRVPVVVLGNAEDLLDYTDSRVRELRPDFSFVRVPSKSSNMAFDEPAEWTRAVVDSVGPCWKER